MKLFTTLFLTLLLSNIASAQMDGKLDQMCEKIKTCSIEQMGTEVPPGMEDMMRAMFDGLCKSMLAPYYESVNQAGLEDKAEACMDTFLEESCEVLMASDGEYTSPECEEFQEAADEAGLDVGQ